MGGPRDTTPTGQREDIQAILLAAHGWGVWAMSEDEIYMRRSIEFIDVSKNEYIRRLYQMEGYMNDLIFNAKFWGVVKLGTNILGQRMWAVMENKPNNPPSRAKLRERRVLKLAKEILARG